MVLHYFFVKLFVIFTASLPNVLILLIRYLDLTLGEEPTL